MDLVLKPVRIATSKGAGRTYLNTFLFLTGSTTLLGLAISAYIIFYLSYIPQVGVKRVIHLQYGDGPHPWGITSLDTTLVSQQPYDVTLSIHVPRSPQNLAQGNFMLSLSLLSPTYSPPPPSTNPAYTAISITNNGPTAALEPTDVVHLSKRPALLKYTSRLVSLSSRLLSLPLYMLSLRQESETLSIPMAESVSFLRGWKNVPKYALLELQAGHNVQVYDVSIRFDARFEGLRWCMYNHRVLSFVVFTSAFWGFEVLFAVLGWLLLKMLLTTRPVKQEPKAEDTGASTIAPKEEATDDEPDLSDTPRTYPTYGRQPPLRYDPPKIKDEDSEDYILDETTILPLVADADDEDDEDGDKGHRDSGLGTSYSEAGERSQLNRRKSRGGRG